MPIGESHKHDDIGSHAFRCRMEQVAFLSLKQQLGDRENVILGEIDVQKDLAAVSVTYPRAGVLFFDVSDPAKPRYLSRWDGTECDQLVIDINCGAFVDVSEDGKTAYLSVQKLTQLPTVPPDPNAGNQAGPGVEVIDVTDPKEPVRVQTYPIAGQGGIHTVRSHTIPEGPSSDAKPRAPGEYVISNQNGVGIDIAKVERVNGKPFLRTVRQDPTTTFVEATIVNNEVHDTFIQNDPLDGRTYLYDAAGFATGFYVYDITDPSRPELVAEWDPTPECDEDWYGHTIDVTFRGNRRYVTMPAELFLQKDDSTDSGLAEMTDEDKGEGCGTFVGNGDKLGPLWIVDATDFSKLGPADDLKSDADADETDATLKQNSLNALVATWTNPANRAAGSLTFTPHNQQIVGDKIYLSHYHGGVYVLDASAAFDGKRERPRGAGLHRAEQRANPPAARAAGAHRHLPALLHRLPARPSRDLGRRPLQGPRAGGRHDRRLLLVPVQGRRGRQLQRRRGAACRASCAAGPASIAAASGCAAGCATAAAAARSGCRSRWRDASAAAVPSCVATAASRAPAPAAGRST